MNFLTVNNFTANYIESFNENFMKFTLGLLFGVGLYFFFSFQYMFLIVAFVLD